jgi:hypothetical protein
LGNPVDSNIRAFYPRLRCYIPLKHPSPFLRAVFPTENLYGLSSVVRMQHDVPVLYFLILCGEWHSPWFNVNKWKYARRIYKNLMQDKFQPVMTCS